VVGRSIGTGCDAGATSLVGADGGLGTCVAGVHVNLDGPAVGVVDSVITGHGGGDLGREDRGQRNTLHLATVSQAYIQGGYCVNGSDLAVVGFRHDFKYLCILLHTHYLSAVCWLIRCLLISALAFSACLNLVNIL